MPYHPRVLLIVILMYASLYGLAIVFQPANFFDSKIPFKTPTFIAQSDLHGVEKLRLEIPRTTESSNLDFTVWNGKVNVYVTTCIPLVLIDAGVCSPGVYNMVINVTESSKFCANDIPVYAIFMGTEEAKVSKTTMNLFVFILKVYRLYIIPYAPFILPVFL